MLKPLLVHVLINYINQIRYKPNEANVFSSSPNSRLDRPQDHPSVELKELQKRIDSMTAENVSLVKRYALKLLIAVKCYFYIVCDTIINGLPFRSSRVHIHDSATPMLSLVRVTLSLVLCFVDRLLYSLLFFAIVLSVLRFTNSDYPIVILKLFLYNIQYTIPRIMFQRKIDD